MKNILRLLLLCLPGLAGFSSCEDNEKKDQEAAYHNPSKIVEESRYIGDFDRIEFPGPGILRIKQAAGAGGPSLAVKADNNLMPLINPSTKDKTLEFNIFPPNFDHKIEYYLTVKTLNKISCSGDSTLITDNPVVSDYIIINGSGKANMDIDLNVRELEINLFGSSQLKLKGKGDKQNIALNGNPDYDGTRLDSEEAELRIFGSGKAQLKVSDELDVDMTGNGQVSYSGHPRLKIRVSGEGTVRSAEDAGANF